MPGILLRANEKILNRVIYYFGGFAPVVTGVLGTLLLDLKYRQLNVEFPQRKSLIIQEGVTQTINIGFHLLSYFGLGTGLKLYLRSTPLPPKVKELATILGANIGGLLGAAVLRPLIGSRIVAKLVKKENTLPERLTALPMSQQFSPPSSIAQPKTNILPPPRIPKPYYAYPPIRPIWPVQNHFSNQARVIPYP